jgi:hypothetical protein
MSSDTYSLIKPYTAAVNSNGFGVVQITQNNHGLAWQIMQIGMSLGLNANSPQCAANINSIPFVSSTVMATSVFASLTGQAPIALTSVFSGPPYPVLEAGDELTVGVIGATAGDTFTVGLFINEIQSPAQVAAIQGSQQANAYVARPGTRRW